MIIRLRRPGDLHGGGYGGCPGRRHVAGTSPKPTGTVTFKDGAAVLGTSTHVTAVAPGTGTPTGSVAYWVDTNYVQTATVNASGDATYTTSSLSGELETPPQPSPRSYLTGRGRR